MMKSLSIKELKDHVIRAHATLDIVDRRYLSEEGIARRDTLSHVLWYLGLVDTYEELVGWDEFTNLVNIPGKHPEYYKVLRQVNRAIERNMKEI